MDGNCAKCGATAPDNAPWYLVIVGDELLCLDCLVERVNAQAVRIAELERIAEDWRNKFFSVLAGRLP